MAGRKRKRAFLSLSSRGGRNSAGKPKNLKPCSYVSHEALEVEDIIRDILLRLPITSLICCRSVSKTWLRVISEPSFSLMYQAMNPTILGFICPSIQDRWFFPINSSVYSGIHAKRNIQKNLKFRNTSDLISHSGVLCSSGGLVFCYRIIGDCGPFLHNPLTNQVVILLPPPSIFEGGPLRFVVYGMVVDFHSKNECSILELSDGVEGLQVNHFSSKTCSWKTSLHHVNSFLGDNYNLIGQSTFLYGYFHWLVEPSGITMYNLEKELFESYVLQEPVDGQSDGTCFCSEMIHLRFIHPQLKRRPLLRERSKCVCRYLGESHRQGQRRLLYIRVTGHSEISIWTLDDYCNRRWSLKHCVNLESLPFSLFYGRILALDHWGSEVLYIRLRDKILTCHLRSGETKEVHGINLRDRAIGVVVPYKLPSFPFPEPPERYFSLLFGSYLCSNTGACRIRTLWEYCCKTAAHIYSPGYCPARPNVHRTCLARDAAMMYLLFDDDLREPPERPFP